MLAAQQAAGLPVDLSIPSGGLGPSDVNGEAELWLELEEFDFGDGVALPMRLHFHSSRSGALKDFGGMGWSSPVFHARAERPKDGGPLLLALPCGKKMRLNPENPQNADTGYSNGEWKGKLEGSLVKVSREDGWELVFGAHGFLQSLKTDDGRTLVWNRAPSSELLSIVEFKAAPGGVRMQAPFTALAVKRDARNAKITGLELNTSYGRRQYSFHYDKSGKLERVGRPSGIADEMAYRLDADENPGLELKRADGIAEFLSWGAKDRKLRFDGIWKYVIEDVDAGHPRITRTGPYGETEVYHDARQASGRVTQISADGTRTIKLYVTRPGPAHGKLERIGRQLKGEEKPVTLYRAVYRNRAQPAEEYDALDRKTVHKYERYDPNTQLAVRRHTIVSPLGNTVVKEYDTKGNLILEKDALGFQTRYVYDQQNRRIKTVAHDGTVIKAVAYTPQGRIASRTDALGAATRYEYDEHGNRVRTIDALGNITQDEYDSFGRRIRTTDPLGHSWTFSYDTGGRLLSQKGPDGVETQRHTYDSRGRRLTTTDAAGNTTALTYDLHGRITSRRDALERVTRYEYDVAGGAVGCELCSAGSSQATTIIAPSGARTVRRFDADLRLVEEAVFEPNSKEPLQTTRQEYDAAGNLVAITDGLGRATRFEYDAENRRIRTIHPDQTERRYAYNAKGQLVEETDELGAATRREYDAYGNLVVITDPEGNTTRTLFEEKESPEVKALHPANRTSPLVPSAYAALHRPTGIQQPSGRRNLIEYDLLGRRIALTTGYATPDAATMRLEFDAVGNEIATTSPTGQVTRHEYDARNRRVKTFDAIGRVWRFEYTATDGASGPSACCGGSPNGNAQAAETIHPDGSKEIRVTDAAGQLIATTDAKGDTIEYRYTPDGRLAELVDGKGSVTKWRYDARGKLLAKTYPDGGVELYEHDAAGQLIRRVRPDGTAALHTYDQRGRLLSVKWDDDRAAPSTYAYDAAGRMTLARNPSASIERGYTAGGRLATETQEITLENSEIRGPKSEIGYAYDPDGRLSVLTYPGGSKVQHYHNARGELIEIIDTLPLEGRKEANARYTYTRRADGRIEKLTHPNGVVTSREYDEAGRLAKITHTDPAGKVLESEASTYDRRDRRLSRTRADGSTDLFRYDPAGQVTAAAYGQAAHGAAGVPPAEPAAQKENPVNPNGNPDNPVKNSDVSQKDFEPAQTFAYDAAGNRLEVTENGMTTKYQPNAANQYAQIQAGTEIVEPEYDPQGNLLHDATRRYTWDADIHLMSVTTRGATGSVAPEKNEQAGGLPRSQPLFNAIDEAPAKTTTTHFHYDPLHRRVAHVKDSGEITAFVYDGWNVIAELTAQISLPGGKNRGTTGSVIKSGASFQLASNLKLTNRYTWGEDLSSSLQGAGGIGGLLSTSFTPAQGSPSPISHLPSPAQSAFMHYDSNGNIVLLTDAQANESARYAYDAFGKTLTATGPAAKTNRYRFSTKPVEEESGLVYYGYRYYDPVTGRWPSRDPIEEMGGLNLYKIAGNSLSNFYDLIGLWSSAGEAIWTALGYAVPGSEFPAAALAAPDAAKIIIINAFKKPCEACLADCSLEPIDCYGPEGICTDYERVKGKLE